MAQSSEFFLHTIIFQIMHPGLISPIRNYFQEIVSESFRMMMRVAPARDFT